MKCKHCDFIARADNPDQSLRMHMARKHGNMQGSTAPKATAKPRVSKKVVLPDTASFIAVSDKFVILEAKDGSIWLAERIK